MTPLPLFRLLQSQGFGSRKACREQVLAGRVTVDGRPCLDPDAAFSGPGRLLGVDGQTWVWRDKAYLMLHKPAGYECSRQTRHHPSVFSLLPLPLVNRSIQPVGRLDQDSTGLLLLSDDGAFVHHYTSPRRHVAKTYRVTCKHPIDDGLAGRLLAGVQLHDDPVPVAALACQRLDEHRLELVIAEGRYHQVKRMVAAAGNRVEALHRYRVGNLDLPAELGPGQWRWLEKADLDALAGGG